MKTQRLALDLPPAWIKAIRQAALNHDQKSAAEFVRQLIADNPAIQQAAHQLHEELPDLMRQWGGHRSKES